MSKRTELCLWVVVPPEPYNPQVVQGSQQVASELHRKELSGGFRWSRDDFWEGESGSDAGYGRMMYRPHRGAVGRGVEREALPGMQREKGIGIGTIVAARCSVEGVLKLMAEPWHGSRQGIFSICDHSRLGWDA